MKINSSSVQRRNERTVNTLLFFRMAAILLSIVVICLSIVNSALAQGSVQVQKNHEYKLDKDTLVVDELVLDDSSRILLTKQISVIKAKRIVIGSGCEIVGRGEKGLEGKNGRSFAAPLGVARQALTVKLERPAVKGEQVKTWLLTLRNCKSDPC
jgi:hypothetical protein